MNVSDALAQRRSVRAYLPTPVPAAILRRLFQDALQAPSNCNVQPWKIHVASGAILQKLSARLLADINSGRAPYPEIDWRLQFDGEHQLRKFASAEALYSTMGIEREDRQARKQALLRNWCFFDAPHVAIFTMEHSLGLAGAVDLGIFAQSLVLAATEQGLGCCLQAALNQFPGPIHEILNIASDHAIMFGMAFGYADTAAPVNSTLTSRADLDTLVTFHS